MGLISRVSSRTYSFHFRRSRMAISAKKDTKLGREALRYPKCTIDIRAYVRCMAEMNSSMIQKMQSPCARLEYTMESCLHAERKAERKEIAKKNKAKALKKYSGFKLPEQPPVAVAAETTTSTQADK